MATQGIVSIVVDGEVKMKIVAGCDGYNAAKLAAELRPRWPIGGYEAYQLALNSSFGSPACLVLLTESGEIWEGGELESLYRETFQQSEFNPRWEQGTADHVVVVELSSSASSEG